MNNNENDKRNVCPDESRTETTKYLVCNFSNLLIAEQRCHRKVGYKNSVCRFDLNVLSKCYDLYLDLMNETYTTKEGQKFEIFEPKYRVVTSIKFRDRIVQSSFVTNYMYPNIIVTHIQNNCACVKNKGVEYARNKLKEILRKSNLTDYCLKVDFKDYFGSINHNVLFNEMLTFLKERWVDLYYKDTINSNHQDVGIGLGSEINQLSAVTLLNNLDHCLEKYNYERYMDDLIFVDTKDNCYKVLNFIKEEAKRLNINVSKKKTYIQPVTKPIKFLGFTFLLHDTRKITMKRLKDKLNRKKRTLRRMKNKGTPFENVLIHYQSVRSSMKKGNRSGVIKLDRYFNNLFKEELRK